MANQSITGITVLVLAGDYRQFDHWRHTQTNALWRGARFIQGVKDLRGLSSATIIQYGTYYRRHDYSEVLDTIRMLMAACGHEVQLLEWTD